MTANILHLPNSPLYNEDNGIDPLDLKDFGIPEVVVFESHDGVEYRLSQTGINKKTLPYCVNEPYYNFAVDVMKQDDIMDKRKTLIMRNIKKQKSTEYYNMLSYDWLYWLIDGPDQCYSSWNDTQKFANLLNIRTPNVIYEGQFDIEKIQTAFDYYCDFNSNDVQGYIVRYKEQFASEDFNESVFQYQYNGTLFAEDADKYENTVLQESFDFNEEEWFEYINKHAYNLARFCSMNIYFSSRKKDKAEVLKYLAQGREAAQLHGSSIFHLINTLIYAEPK